MNPEENERMCDCGCWMTSEDGLLWICTVCGDILDLELFIDED